MLGGDLSLSDGASSGAWIKEGLGGEFDGVVSMVPKGFESYARILHPAADLEGNLVRWAEVAGALGTSLRRDIWWEDIPGSSSWPGSAPQPGALDLDDLDGLCKILATHTADPTHCYFGLCTIEGWVHDFTTEELTGIRQLKLPLDRNYIVLSGPLSAIDQIIRDYSKPAPGRFVMGFDQRGGGPPPELDPSKFRIRESPHLIWPADRSWIVYTDVDLDWGLLGGGAALVDAVVASTALEAWRVDPSDFAFD